MNLSCSLCSRKANTGSKTMRILNDLTRELKMTYRRWLHNDGSVWLNNRTKTLKGLTLSSNEYCSRTTCERLMFSLYTYQPNVSNTSRTYGRLRSERTLSQTGRKFYRNNLDCSASKNERSLWRGNVGIKRSRTRARLKISGDRDLSSRKTRI